MLVSGVPMAEKVIRTIAYTHFSPADLHGCSANANSAS